MEDDESDFEKRELSMENVTEDGGVKKRVLLSGLEEKVVAFVLLWFCLFSLERSRVMFSKIHVVVVVVVG